MKVKLPNGETRVVETDQRWVIKTAPESAAVSTDPKFTMLIERLHDGFILYQRRSDPFNSRAMMNKVFTALVMGGYAVPLESEEVTDLGF